MDDLLSKFNQTYIIQYQEKYDYKLLWVCGKDPPTIVYNQYFHTTISASSTSRRRPHLCPQVKKSVHMLECTVQSLVIKWMVPIVLVTSNNPIVIPQKKIFKLCDMCHNGKGNMKDLFSIFHN